MVKRTSLGFGEFLVALLPEQGHLIAATIKMGPYLQFTNHEISLTSLLEEIQKILGENGITTSLKQDIPLLRGQSEGVHFAIGVRSCLVAEGITTSIDKTTPIVNWVHGKDASIEGEIAPLLGHNP